MHLLDRLSLKQKMIAVTLLTSAAALAVSILLLAAYGRLYRNIDILVVTLLLGMTIALLLGARLQPVLFDPLVRLSETARLISVRKDYALRAERHGSDEIGALIDSFNGMLAQIQKRDAELQEARVASELASQAKSRFLSFMSHELRTPMTSILGFTEFLLEEAQTEGRAEAAEDLRRVYDSARYLLDLINDVLDLSKVEAGRMELHRESFEVFPVVSGLQDVMRPMLEKQKNRFELRCGKGLGAMESDATRVRQCLLNLLGNACKFTENGVVSLAIERTARGGADWLIFRVTDTGIGMSEKQMAKLFQPFVQAEESTSRRYGGTGLGLALTRRFCQLMGGDVSVESKTAAGSTFTMELPAVSPEAAAGAVGSSAAAAA